MRETPMTNRFDAAIVALLAVIAIELALLLARPSVGPAELQQPDMSAVTDELQQINGMLQQLCTVTYAGANPSASPDDAQGACGNP
jgi:hypothetical protein